MKHKNTILIIAILCIGLLIVGSTYAVYSFMWTSELELTNGGTFADKSECFDITYDAGTDLKGRLFPSSTPLGGLSSDMTVGINANCSVVGKLDINLNIDEGSDPNGILTQTVDAHCENPNTLETLTTSTTEETCTNNNGIWVSDGTALKYAVYKSEEILSVGYINARSGTINIYSGIINPGVKDYTIKVWLDGNLSDNTYENQSFSAKINASIEQQEGSVTETGTAYAVYTLSDNSLRFYRESNTQVANNNLNNTFVQPNFKGNNNINIQGLSFKNNYNNIITIEDSETIIFEGIETSVYTSETAVPWYEYREDISSVYFEDAISPISTAYWFSNFTDVTQIDLDNLNTSNVTNMEYMFSYTGTNSADFVLDLGNYFTFPTGSNITNFASNCGAKKLIIPKSVTNIPENTFTNMNNLTEIVFEHSAEDPITLPSSGGSFSVLSNINTTIKTSNDTIINYGWSTDLRTVTIEIPVIYTYAIYSETDNSLRFYKNTDEVTTGTTYNNLSVTAIYSNNIETSSYSNSSIVPWYSYMENIEKVYIEDTISPVSTRSWFDGMKNATYINLSKLDTSNVTTMYRMFDETGKSATTFEIIGLSSWDTSNVTDMRYMFYSAGYNATTWSIGDLSSWDTSSVTDMVGIFYYAGYSATTWSIGNLSSWDTSSVTSMNSIFSYAGYSATSWNIGDLSNWDTSSVTSMSTMFYHAGYSATTWSIGNLSSWDTSSVTNMSYMFRGAGYSASNWALNLSGWDTSNVTDMNQMIGNAGRSATTWSIGDLSSWDTSSVTSMGSMFDEAGYSATTWSIGNLSSWDTSNVTNMRYMFDSAGYSATTFELNLSNWDTSSVTDMGGMFYRAGYSATSFSIGNLSSWDTSSVTSMGYMFYYAGYSATTFELNLSNWDTSSVTTMYSMFSHAGRSATTWSIGNLSSWDTSSVTDMDSMFYHAGYSASNWSLNLSGWNVNNVTSYSGFNGGVTSKVTAPTWVN